MNSFQNCNKFFNLYVPCRKPSGDPSRVPRSTKDGIKALLPTSIRLDMPDRAKWSHETHRVS